jgi:hypothetical protein
MRCTNLTVPEAPPDMVTEATIVGWAARTTHSLVKVKPPVIHKAATSSIGPEPFELPFVCKACLLFLLVLLTSPAAFSDKAATSGEGFSMDLPNSEADVLTAVQALVDDHIIHGTYVYEREKTLNEASAETSSAYFGTWQEPGRAFYKVRRDALAPRNFKNSSDIGVITVRYIVRSVSETRTHLEIKAVFVEDGTRRVHASDGTVETSEYAELQIHLADLQKERAQAAQITQKRAAVAEEAALAKQKEEEVGRYQAAQSSVKTLEQRLNELQHAVEVRVPAQDTELKSAPFRSAATLTKIPANSDVLVEIVTAYWYGVETADGHRGWVRRDQVVPLP